MHKQQGNVFSVFLNYFPNSSIGSKHIKDNFSIYFPHKPIIVPPLLFNKKPRNKPN
jgi:hypothetical protein